MGNPLSDAHAAQLAALDAKHRRELDEHNRVWGKKFSELADKERDARLAAKNGGKVPEPSGGYAISAEAQARKDALQASKAAKRKSDASKGGKAAKAKR